MPSSSMPSVSCHASRPLTPGSTAMHDVSATQPSHASHPSTHQKHHQTGHYPLDLPSSLAQQLGRCDTAQLRILQPGLVVSCTDVGLDWTSGTGEGQAVSAGAPNPASTGGGFSCYQLHVFDMADAAAAAVAAGASSSSSLSPNSSKNQAEPAPEACAQSSPHQPPQPTPHLQPLTSPHSAALAHEFAAIPSQLPQHSAQHSRPMPLWPPPSSDTPTVVTSSSSSCAAPSCPPSVHMGIGYTGAKGTAPAPSFWTHPQGLQVCVCVCVSVLCT